MDVEPISLLHAWKGLTAAKHLSDTHTPTFFPHLSMTFTRHVSSESFSWMHWAGKLFHCLESIEFVNLIFVRLSFLLLSHWFTLKKHTFVLETVAKTVPTSVSSCSWSLQKHGSKAHTLYVLYSNRGSTSGCPQRFDHNIKKSKCYSPRNIYLQTRENRFYSAWQVPLLTNTLVPDSHDESQYRDLDLSSV